MSTDPEWTSISFLKALNIIPDLMDQYNAGNGKQEKDLSVLQENVNTIWRREDDLKALKSRL